MASWGYNEFLTSFKTLSIYKQFDVVSILKSLNNQKGHIIMAKVYGIHLQCPVYNQDEIQWYGKLCYNATTCATPYSFTIQNLVRTFITK